jgi:hypothetical protein
MSRPTRLSGLRRWAGCVARKKRLTSARHAGLKDPAPHHDAGASSTKPLEKNSGFPFDVAQGGEFIEPRVKPGMTKQKYVALCQ